MRAARRRRYVARADVMEVLYRVYLGAISARSSSSPSSPARCTKCPPTPARSTSIRAHAPAVHRPRRRRAGARRAALGSPRRAAGDRGGRGPLHAAGAGLAAHRAAAGGAGAAAHRGARRRDLRRRRRQLRLPPLPGLARSSGSAALAPFGALRADRACSARRWSPAAGACDRRWRARSACCSSPGRRSTWRSAGTARRRRCSATWRRCRSSTAADELLAALGAALALAACSPRACSASAASRSRRRGGAPQLVAEMRFSASVQDLRTVILLRRQLASEQPAPQALAPPAGATACPPADLAARLAELPALAGGADRPRRPDRGRRGRRPRGRRLRPHPGPLRPARPAPLRRRARPDRAARPGVRPPAAPRPAPGRSEGADLPPPAGAGERDGGGGAAGNLDRDGPGSERHRGCGRRGDGGLRPPPCCFAVRPSAPPTTPTRTC